MTSKSTLTLYTPSLYDTITCNLHKMKFYYKTNNKYKKKNTRSLQAKELADINQKRTR